MSEEAFVKLCLAMHLDEICPLCGVAFKTIEELSTTAVWWENGTIAHKSCYEKAIAKDAT